MYKFRQNIHFSDDIEDLCSVQLVRK